MSNTRRTCSSDHVVSAALLSVYVALMYIIYSKGLTFICYIGNMSDQYSRMQPADESNRTTFCVCSLLKSASFYVCAGAEKVRRWKRVIR